MFEKHIKRPSPDALRPADAAPRYELRDVLKSSVERLYERATSLRTQAEEFEREAGQALAVIESGEL